MAKCEKCGRETKELFENRISKEVLLVCDKCKDIRYNTTRGYKVNSFIPKANNFRGGLL